MLALFVFGNTRTPMEQALKQMQPQQEKSMPDAPSLDFVHWIDSVKALIPALQADSLAMIENQLAKAELPEQKVQLNKELSAIWQRLFLPGPSAHYLNQVAQLENTAPSWIESGTQFFVANRLTKDPKLKQFFANESQQALDKAIELEPKNLDAKIALAKTYVDAQNQVMQGVFLLREVEEADSNHLEANIMLGRLSMISQQYEKAVKRMEKVLSLEPQNTEAMYYLGEASLQLGDPEKAISLFKQCRDLVENPAFKLEIDNYIQQIQINP